jgi:hypothetical protein
MIKDRRAGLGLYELSNELIDRTISEPLCARPESRSQVGLSQIKIGCGIKGGPDE